MPTTSARAKELRIKRLFSLSMDEYNLLGNKCMICGQDGKTKQISVDHDHMTGEVRGRLCMKCNRGISLFKDDWKLLNLASLYVKTPPATLLLGRTPFGRTGRVNKKVKRKKNGKKK